MNLKKIFPLLMTIPLLLAACKGVTGAKESQVSNATTPVPTETTPAPTKLAPTAQTVAANCTVVSRVSQPDPTQASLFPPITEKDWSRGPETAKVTFIEYSDFQ